MLSGFKQFVLRGNVVDLAVGVVIGAAFGTVVTALVKDLINPTIALLVGKPDFTGISFTIGSTVFPIGDFFTAVVSFLLVAAAVYFFVVTPINALIARSRKDAAPADPTTKKCPECLSEIPISDHGQDHLETCGRLDRVRLFSRQQDDFACFNGQWLASNCNLCFSFNGLHERIERGGVFAQPLPFIEREDRDIPLLPFKDDPAHDGSLLIID